MRSRSARVLVLACLGLALPPACGEAAAEPADAPTADLPETVRERLAPEVLAALGEALERVADAPSEPDAWLDLGMTYEAHGLLRDAVGAYAQAEKRSQTPGAPAYHVGRALAALGEADAALEAFERARTGAADYAPLHDRLGTLLLETGRLDEADQAFRRAAQLDPQGFAGALGLARVALAREDPEAVLDLLRPWAVLHPEQGEIQHLIGRAQRMAGRLAEAQAALARWDGRLAPRPDPWAEEVARHRAGYLAIMDEALEQGRAGRPADAIQALADLHAADPDDSAALEKLVLALREAGDADGARGVLQRALQRDDSHYRAWFALAEVDEQRGDLRAALNAVGQCLQRQPSFVRGHELAARLLWKAGDVPAAALALADALTYGGPDVANLRKLGRARASLREWDDAADALARALELTPGDVELLAELADAQLHAGRLDACAATLDQLGDVAPEHPDLADLRARLGRALAPDRDDP